MFTRRQLLRSTGLSLLGASASGWAPRLAAASEGRAGRRHCVLLWMNGGPSQTDTFDLKPGHENGGPFKEIATSAPGLRFSEHLPKLAQHADCLAVLRGLSSAEGDHGRGTYLMRTGHSPTGAVRYPSVGASLSKELGGAADALPGYVAISPYRTFNRDAYGPGFLGSRHAPLTVAASDGYQAQPAAQPGPGQFAQLQVDDLAAIEGVDADRAAARLGLWESLESSFLSSHAAEGPLAHRTLYERATRMMRSRAAEAFELEQEPDAVREAYGQGRFGQ